MPPPRSVLPQPRPQRLPPSPPVHRGPPSPVTPGMHSLLLPAWHWHCPLGVMVTSARPTEEDVAQALVMMTVSTPLLEKASAQALVMMIAHPLLEKVSAQALLLMASLAQPVCSRTWLQRGASGP